ncbi:P-loop containing nucleoside triphosphate hydrolase protein [Serendipita vermifera]|nr:P-loop containing nucleoside triphosphate hydrolase protein [Serendipita vermifera]
MSSPLQSKVVLVGDCGVGKTSLLFYFHYGWHCQEWRPSFFQTTVSTVELDGETHRLVLWDTSAREYYTDLRPMSYSQSHVVAICYSVDNPNSLRLTEERWVPEVCHFSPGTPFILVGCKLDMRENMEEAGMEFVSKEQGASMADRIGAKAHVECSSMTGEGTSEVFHKALVVALEHRRAMPRRNRHKVPCIPF